MQPSTLDRINVNELEIKHAAEILSNDITQLRVSCETINTTAAPMQHLRFPHPLGIDVGILG